MIWATFTMRLRRVDLLALAFIHSVNANGAAFSPAPEAGPEVSTHLACLEITQTSIWSATETTQSA
jgi:hypothetical protein